VPTSVVFPDCEEPLAGANATILSTQPLGEPYRLNSWVDFACVDDCHRQVGGDERMFCRRDPVDGFLWDGIPMECAGSHFNIENMGILF